MAIAGDLLVGGTLRVQPTPYDAGNHPLSGRQFSYVSSNPAVAKVDRSGLVTGVAVGVATVTVTAEGKSAVTTIRVVTQISNVIVGNVLVTPPGLPVATVPALGTLPLAALVSDSAGQALSSLGLAWSSSNNAIATVDPVTGVVTGVAIGTCTITGSLGGVYSAITLNVTQAQDGSHADLVATIGDASLDTSYDPLLANTNDGAGHVLTVPDVRGTTRNPVVYTAVANGSTLPTIDLVAGEIATNATNYLQSTEELVFNIGDSGTKVFFSVGTVALGAPFHTESAIQKLDASHFAEVILNGSDISVQYEGVLVDAGVGVQAGLVLLIVTLTGLPGTRGTLVNPFRSVEIGGRLRMIANSLNTGTLPYGAYAGTIGGLKGGGFAGSPVRRRLWGSINRPITLADKRAIFRRAIARGGTILANEAGGRFKGSGDSRFFGFPNAPGSGAPTDRIITRLGVTWAVSNLGAPSRSIAEMVTVGPMLFASDADVLSGGAHNIAGLWGGVNPGGLNGVGIVAQINQWVQDRIAEGYPELMLTTEVLPTPDLPTVNAGILAVPAAVAVSNPGVRIRIARLDQHPELNDIHNITYRDGDGSEHFTAAGSLIIGDAMADAILAP